VRSTSLRCVLSVAAAGALPLAARAQGPTAPKVTGYVQTRFEAIADSALFKVRRARLGVQGGLTPWASYKLQAELRSGGTGATAATVAATDLYVALTHGPWIATIGQSKTPLSVEFIRSSTVLELPERSMVVDSLAPNRDVGVKIEWNSTGPLTLNGGVFNGDGINRAANRDKDFLYMARAVVRPIAGLHLGAAAAGKPDTTTWDIEGTLERGRVAARAEYLWRHRSPRTSRREAGMRSRRTSCNPSASSSSAGFSSSTPMTPRAAIASRGTPAAPSISSRGTT